MRLRAVRFFALVLLLNVMAVSGALGSGRAQSRFYDSPYTCLIYGGYGNNGNILDLRSGLYHTDPRTQANTLYTPGELSPDHQYRAYLVWNQRPDQTNTLYIYLAKGGKIAVQDNITSPFYFFWSPDSQRFAYTYANASEVTLSIAHADGSELQHVRIPTLNPLDVIVNGWSPDGRYLLIGTREWDGRRWTLSNTQGQMVASTGAWDWVERAEWSPDSSHLLYLASTSSSSPMSVNIFNLATFSERAHALVASTNYVNTRWSSKGRYLLVTYGTAAPDLIWHLDVFDVDGPEYRLSLDTDRSKSRSIEQAAQWLMNGEQIAYFQDKTLKVFTPAVHETLEIVANLVKGPFPAPNQPDRVALVERDAKLVQGVLLNLDGTQRTTLFQTDGDYGDAAWSADGHYVAFTWSSGRAAQRDVHLSWVKADGSGLQDIHGFVDLRDVEYYGDRAVFLVKETAASDFNLNLLDLRTGAMTPFGNTFSEVLYVDTEPNTGDYRVWWRDQHGALGVDAYTIAGQLPMTRRFNFGLPKVAIKNPPPFFVAPGGEVAAIKFGDYLIHEYLQLSRSDGSTTHLIASPDVGLGDPLWSPDGKLVAFTQAVRNPNQTSPYTPITLEVYTADGQPVRSISRPGNSYGNLAWTSCQ